MATNITVPNMNPTGVTGAGSFNGGTSFSFPGTGSGGPGTLNFGNSMNPQPAGGPLLMPGWAMVSPTVSPTTGTGAPAPVTGENNQTSSTPNSFNQTSRQQSRSLGELQTYYGEGIGSMLYQYLQSGAGYNGALTQQAIDAQNNAMQQNISLGANSLLGSLGAMGLSSSSSGVPMALSNYETQAATQENSIAAQEYYNMWNESQQREYGMLGQVAQVNATGTANQSTWEDYLNTALGVVGDVGTLGMSGALGSGVQGAMGF